MKKEWYLKMEDSINIVNIIYSNAKKMSATDKKIATVILDNPNKAINFTISELSQKASVSEASISRFCKNLDLSGFHQLKILLAKVAGDESNYYKSVHVDNIQRSLSNIADNKTAEIVNTLTVLSKNTIQNVLSIIEQAKVVQVIAEGDTLPVADDATYKFNQLGIFTITSAVWETSIAQTLNLDSDAVLIVISNSGESRSLLKQIEIAKKKDIKIISITNRDNSPIALQSNFHLTTAVRQKILQSEYYFSRVAALTMIEALFLLLLSNNKVRLSSIKEHEDIISGKKI